MRTPLPIALVLLVAAPLAGAFQGSSFTPLPLDVTGYFSPAGVSADGGSVVGMAYILGSGDRARRWRNGVGFDDPGANVNPAIASWASAISADGSVIVGGSGHAVFGDLEGWLRHGTSVGGVGSPAGHDTSDLLAVSHDGGVAVGYGGLQSNPNLFEAALYDQQGGWMPLGTLPGGTNSKATATDADGSVVAGWSNDAGLYASLAFRWTAADGMVSLGSFPGGSSTRPTGMNADGTVLCGYDETSGTHAWRWTQASGIVPLPELPGGTDSYALAVSPDGALVVGTASDAGGSFHAVLWDAVHGVRELRDVLLGLGVSGVATWELDSATCIAGDGPYWLAGDGVDSAGPGGGWLARLDEGVPGGTRTFCAGDGSATPCPCGNDAGAVSGCVNSSGQGAAMSASGSVSVARDDLALEVLHVPANKLGIVFMGSAVAGAGQGTPFGDGLLCAGGQILRFPAQSSGASGTFQLQGPVAASGGLIGAGSSWVFQAWYRDPQGPCGSGSNLSDALEAGFVP